jgi:hypothetical protein
VEGGTRTNQDADGGSGVGMSVPAPPPRSISSTHEQRQHSLWDESASQLVLADVSSFPLEGYDWRRAHIAIVERVCTCQCTIACG